MNAANLKTNVLLVLVSVVIAAALTYASIALPELLNSLLFDAFDFPGYDAWHPVNLEEAQTFFQENHIRLIGYGSLTLVLILIVAGLVIEKRSFATLGAIAFFLPVLGHFALSMFFLAGLGLLRIIWVPLLDISYDILKLGDVVYLPFRWLVSLLSLVRLDGWLSTIGLDLRDVVVFLFIGFGLLVFILGTQAWFYSKAKRRNMADFWLYRFSRHPQYLGWILWSYGILNYVSIHSKLTRFKLCYEMHSSLPWLLSTLIIVGVAMLEEVRMRRSLGDEYEAYRKRTPFLFPLPGLVSRIIRLPMKLVLRKDTPESGREIAVVLSVYGILLASLSFLL